MSDAKRTSDVRDTGHADNVRDKGHLPSDERNTATCPACLQSRSAAHDRDANEREIERLRAELVKAQQLAMRQANELRKRA